MLGMLILMKPFSTAHLQAFVLYWGLSHSFQALEEGRDSALL